MRVSLGERGGREGVGVRCIGGGFGNDGRTPLQRLLVEAPKHRNRASSVNPLEGEND